MNTHKNDNENKMNLLPFSSTTATVFLIDEKLLNL